MHSFPFPLRPALTVSWDHIAGSRSIPVPLGCINTDCIQIPWIYPSGGRRVIMNQQDLHCVIKSKLLNPKDRKSRKAKSNKDLCVLCGLCG